ncbi:MAG: NifB/NifX family molybdenum-iron cluster-binding protein [Campylobacterota bacterium]|nr:NifB/NifX family molybdenum-iron cluster-binding protein [Campylobacterota bacterium]
MKLVIPVKMNKENSAVAPLFGKAKWFAFVEDGKVMIEKNPVQGGAAVIKWFTEQNVEAIIFQEMGTTPYEMIKTEGGMKLYHAGYDRILLDELLQKFNKGELVELDDTKMAEIIKSHEGSHTHGDGQGHQHH